MKEFIAVKVLVLILCPVVLLSTAGESKAESSIATGNGTAAAHLNFRVHIPATLYLQIGTVDRKQNTTQSELNYAKEANSVSQYKKSFTIKALSRLSKKGAMLLSSNASTLANNETLFYTLSSP
ncbi:MAG: hypothetical protein JRD05_11435 [Deltaproteobacteria bacterium]|nr:hypothetical protein [Deltaproteobacteria bacterium]